MNFANLVVLKEELPKYAVRKYVCYNQCLKKAMVEKMLILGLSESRMPDSRIRSQI